MLLWQQVITGGFDGPDQLLEFTNNTLSFGDTLSDLMAWT